MLPSKRGLIFLQQVMPPSLVYWPKAVSKTNVGIPQVNRKMRYGMRNAPAFIKVEYYEYNIATQSTVKIEHAATFITSA